jgi:hypothetical protein
MEARSKGGWKKEEERRRWKGHWRDVREGVWIKAGEIMMEEEGVNEGGERDVEKVIFEVLACEQKACS